MSDVAKAFISFLRCEAQQAEDRAKSLRATAATIEANSLETQRKHTKRRKRTREPDSQESKTSIAGYALFAHENHETGDKPENPDGTESLENRWKNLCDEEKQAWESRAEDLALHRHSKRSNRNESIQGDKTPKSA
eukprot:jgi/Psemu1/300952/fgenesh1_kg.22_\